MQSPGFSIIVAYEKTRRGIGFQNNIPWCIPEDMAFFRKTTTHTYDPQKINVVIMGKNTWHSLPKKTLPKRINICITTQTYENTPEMQFAHSLDDALQQVCTSPSVESVFVVGGAKVYQESILHPLCKEIIVHELLFEQNNIPQTDSFFPEIPEQIYQELKLLPKINIDNSVQIQPRRFLRKSCLP